MNAPASSAASHLAVSDGASALGPMVFAVR
jgi:hypothetical protein